MTTIEIWAMALSTALTIGLLYSIIKMGLD